nr:MAG TPA: hypothetical protein [Bacteriophage sp.]
MKSKEELIFLLFNFKFNCCSFFFFEFINFFHSSLKLFL